MSPHEQKHSFAYHKVERHVTRMIRNGHWHSGDRLPSVRELARSMKVSIATIVHAYTELERKGIVETRPRSGHFVRSSTQLFAGLRGQSSTTPQKVNRSHLISIVLESVGNHELLPFGVLCPDTSLLPLKALTRLMGEVMRQAPHVATAYEAVHGNNLLRNVIAERMEACGMAEDPKRLLVTNGTVEALYIALRSLTRPGDIVVIQSPTYYGFLQLLESLGLRVIEAPSSPERGIDPVAIRHILERHQVACCIFSPNFNNPDGSLTPDEAKREILQILQKYGTHIIEDDVAGDLHYGSARPSTFFQWDTNGLVTLCSSFSKTVAPGFRVGWMAPGRILEQALQVKATTNICSPTPTQMALARYLEQGLLATHLKKLRTALYRQMERMRQSIQDSFPQGTTITRPQGGGVLWVRLPHHVDSIDLFFRARDAGIAISPGAIFSAQDNFTNYIRLGCNGIWNSDMDAGLRTLGNLAHTESQITPKLL